MEIKASKKPIFKQQSLFGFMTSKENSPKQFVPIDRTEPSTTLPQKRGRGRPRKYNLPNADHQSSPNPAPNQNVEELTEENIGTTLSRSHSKKHYHVMDFKTKLNILKEFDAFKANPPKFNGKQQTN